MKLGKTIMAVLVMMIFVLSIVPVLAEDDSAVAVDVSDEVAVEADGVAVDVIGDDVRAEAKQKLGQAKVRVRRAAAKQVKDARDDIKDAARDKASDLRNDIKDRAQDRLDERKNLKDRYKAARSDVKDATKRFSVLKQQHAQLRENYKDHKAELRDLKKAAQCDDSEECEEKKRDLRKGVRLHLLKTSDVIEQSLLKLQDRIENSDLDDSEKERAIAVIEDLLADLAAAVEEVEALSEDSSAEEIRSAIENLKSVWKDVKKEQRALVHGLIHHKQGEILHRLDTIVEGMDRRIDSLGDDVDTSKLESLKDDFIAHVTDAQEHHDAMKDMKEAGDREGFAAAQEEFRTALKMAKESLREFVALFRELSTE